MPSKEDLWRWCWIKQHFQRSDRVRSFEPLPRPLRVNLPESLVFGLSKVLLWTPCALYCYVEASYI